MTNLQMTVDQAFQKFLEAIEITELQRERAMKQMRRVRAILDERLKPDDVLVSGSFGRRTAIQPLHDIDLFVVLSEHIYGRLRGQPAKRCLDEVQATLQRAHSQGVSIRPQRRSVNITFKDTDIGYDVVPAFRLAEKHDAYIIPDVDRESWIKTNPAQHAEVCNQAEARCGRVLKQLIKAAKRWNVEHGKQIGSFHLEVMSYDVTLRSPASQIERFQQLLAHLASKILRACPDPAGPGNPHIERGKDQSWREQRAKQLRNAAEKVQRAVELDRQGGDGPLTQAHEILGKLLGQDFYPGR